MPAIRDLRARRNAAATTRAAFTRATSALARSATTCTRTPASFPWTAFAGTSPTFTPSATAAFAATSATFAATSFASAASAAASGAGVWLSAPALLRTQTHRRQNRAADSEEPEEKSTTIHRASSAECTLKRAG